VSWFSDGEGPRMEEIYEIMDCMVCEIKDIMTKDDNPHKDNFVEVESIVIGRWERMNLHLHCLAYALCPKFYQQQYLNTPAPGGTIRQAPNKKEVMTNVLAAIASIADSSRERQCFREQFNAFIMKKGMFALPPIQLDAFTMDPIEWWVSYGSKTPDLAEVAKNVLSQLISSSSAERIWSTFNHIHIVKRNMMNTSTADKLVFIHSNLRLLSRSIEDYKQGAHAKWDINPDDSSI
jgi:hypothetical protein